MESLSETQWDLVIEGTGLKHSLLALALSRSNKKILHVDNNEYYGDEEAAFSLQETDAWVKRSHTQSGTSTFSNASATYNSTLKEKLGFSRAYNLTLSPQIIYTRSPLLSSLVSSKVYKQLEFQAVGSWFLYDDAALKRLPSGREDIFQDNSIDNRAKRSLMKFLKFVVDYENQVEVWRGKAEMGLSEFLADEFKLPQNLQTLIGALTLSLDTLEGTKVEYALPRIQRHLTSIGVFGPGFGAVVPKWGGGAEIAQVACRAGAVGGGVYVLGTGIRGTKCIEAEGITTFEVDLSNDEKVNTRYITRTDHDAPPAGIRVAKAMAIVSSPLASLFTSTVEGSPTSAVSVIVFPAKILVASNFSQDYPVYIMAHSSETGECPAGQCILYATTLLPESSTTQAGKFLLDDAMSKFLATTEGDDGQVLYSVYYEQQGSKEKLDLAFNDQVLVDVEEEWRRVSDGTEETPFLVFEERNGMSDDEGAEY
ncbi:putative rab geranylgeranyl transferase escort protein [Botrytis fragariae]|uniref:Rab proteins geranylgeranyltransferase n=1 Tax=Botrytis fragariae TaxID=1964551 RepID=A0A8H6ASX3_9HELO|nr:putative rab geranylgeranyl transferase escort protein [Botrytis fragariae]KAF5873006.1 putative rab geranylgeranyl transferase escort protein [Botrytis fragariae]